MIIAALPGYRFAPTVHWLDNALQRITSLASSSKKSIVSRLERNSSHEFKESHEIAARESTKKSHDLEPLNAREAHLGLRLKTSRRCNLTERALKGPRKTLTFFKRSWLKVHLIHKGAVGDLMGAE